MSSETKDINTQNAEMFKTLGEITKQNSESIIKQTESITTLSEGQTGIAKTLVDITEAIKKVGSSDNNNPTGPGVGMEQKDGSKVTIPNVVAPDEISDKTGPATNKPGLSMEAKKEFELKLKAEEKEAKDRKDFEDYKEKKKAEENKPEEKKTDDKPMEEKKTDDKPEEKKTDDKPMKEEKYKSFNYEDNTTFRPQTMTKQFESYPDGYQIIKAALSGWGIEGIDGDGAYTETLTKLNNREFGSFGQEMGANN